MGFDGGGGFRDSDEMVVAVAGAVQEGAVALGEEVLLLVEDGQRHRRVDGGELEPVAFDDVFGAVPLAGGILVEEGFDGEIEGGDECARIGGGLDAAAGGDDGGDELALLGTALEPAAGGEEFPAGGLDVVASLCIVSIGETRPAAGGDRNRRDEGGGIDGEGGRCHHAGAGELFLLDERGVLVSVRADFHEDEAGAIAAEAVLKDDEGDEDQRGGGGDDGGGDEKPVASAGFREDEKVHRADKDAEGEEDDDEEDVVEGFLAEGFLERPAGIEIVGDRLQAGFRGAAGGGEIDGGLGIEFQVGSDGNDQCFSEALAIGDAE